MTVTDQLRVIEPATEEVLEEVPRAGIAEVDAAVERARAAYPAWRAISPSDRAMLLRRLAAAVESAREELAVLEARNAGKPIGDARGEMGDGGSDDRLLRRRARAAARRHHSRVRRPGVHGP